ncbi:hypothetical protein HBI73_214620 [Parastagonospora nodorum]|nr:hypothetical protein HBH82_230330 [Parastagonospora nodorum]KAH4661410.1 hypothetical protein HBH78_222360 [Parastagonospora nodorum]KAH4691535.1 hypothetical protein HBH67_243270 [Parastagonospora nodorum]KAH4755748.1 hypothetical protein HBH63_231140 [Parastagonospora nodorum]KAH4769790.1 hypothetical protein HBH62_227800 [Parastagonospora nodorum]
MKNRGVCYTNKSVNACRTIYMTTVKEIARLSMLCTKTEYIKNDGLARTEGLALSLFSAFVPEIEVSIEAVYIALMMDAKSEWSTSAMCTNVTRVKDTAKAESIEEGINLASTSDTFSRSLFLGNMSNFTSFGESAPFMPIRAEFEASLLHTQNKMCHHRRYMDAATSTVPSATKDQQVRPVNDRLESVQRRMMKRSSPGCQWPPQAKRHCNVEPLAVGRSLNSEHDLILRHDAVSSLCGPLLPISHRAVMFNYGGRIHPLVLLSQHLLRVQLRGWSTYDVRLRRTACRFRRTLPTQNKSHERALPY